MLEGARLNKTNGSKSPRLRCEKNHIISVEQRTAKQQASYDAHRTTTDRPVTFFSCPARSEALWADAHPTFSFVQLFFFYFPTLLKLLGALRMAQTLHVSNTLSTVCECFGDSIHQIPKMKRFHTTFYFTYTPITPFL